MSTRVTSANNCSIHPAAGIGTIWLVFQNHQKMFDSGLKKGLSPFFKAKPFVKPSGLLLGVELESADSPNPAFPQHEFDQLPANAHSPPFESKGYSFEFRPSSGNKTHPRRGNGFSRDFSQKMQGFLFK